MLNWFSISGISKEIKRIRWPNKKDLGSKTVEVLSFIILFSMFFIAVDFITSLLLKALGVL